MAPMTGIVRSEIDAHGIGWLTLDNPAKLNALSVEMWRQLSEAIERCRSDATVRCVVVKGAGDRSFCVGADISELEAIRPGPGSAGDFNRMTAGALASLGALEKPTIAMIRGLCFGGGVALAISCDFRIASVDARFSIPAARLGIGYPFSAVKRLTDLVGPSAAKRMLFTAERSGAEEMRRAGLVDEVVEAAELEPRVRALAATMAANAPLSIAAAKFAVEAATTSSPDLAGCAAREQACLDSEDHVEGRRAFMEKRAPVFRGR